MSRCFVEIPLSRIKERLPAVRQRLAEAQELGPAEVVANLLAEAERLEGIIELADDLQVDYFMADRTEAEQFGWTA